MSSSFERIKKLVSDGVVQAGTTLRDEHKNIYKQAISQEQNPNAKWVLETILNNIETAQKNKTPLCDDTGIPHLVLEIGPNTILTGKTLEAIKSGITDGLRRMPGRPMGINGNDYERLDQSAGINPDSGAVEPAPILIRQCNEDILRLHILMFGGGPAIRGKTYRVFHKHNVDVIIDEIVSWAKESVAQLGCSPCTLAVGIGRSQFEATSMMLEALIEGSFEKQTELEDKITKRLNQTDIGPIGIHGNCSVLATFVKVGPQRASGVRIVCLRPCCCIEPRIATVDLS